MSDEPKSHASGIDGPGHLGHQLLRGKFKFSMTITLARFIPDPHRIDQLGRPLNPITPAHRTAATMYGSDDLLGRPIRAASDAPIYVSTVTVLPMIRTVTKALLLASFISRNRLSKSA